MLDQFSINLLTQRKRFMLHFSLVSLIISTVLLTIVYSRFFDAFGSVGVAMILLLGGNVRTTLELETKYGIHS